MNKKRFVIFEKNPSLEMLVIQILITCQYFIKSKILFKKILFTLLISKNKKKLFNLYYFSLRNIIECIFKVTKNWFLYLKIALKFLK